MAGAHATVASAPAWSAGPSLASGRSMQGALVGVGVPSRHSAEQAQAPRCEKVAAAVQVVERAL